jgi:hypothetical protein
LNRHTESGVDHLGFLCCQPFLLASSLQIHLSLIPFSQWLWKKNSEGKGRAKRERAEKAPDVWRGRVTACDCRFDGLLDTRATRGEG